MSLALHVQDLTKIYIDPKNRKPKPALDGLNLKVPEGIIFGLLGPNGAGKSTLINIIGGIVTKNSGSVNIMGIDRATSPKLASCSIGIVPQEIALDNFFPIAKTLEFTAGYYGVPPENRKTEEILKALGLWDKRNAFPRQLSGGMKRRFLVAKAMVHLPKILILDEPTAGVDIELRDQLWEYVKKSNAAGTTIIITTHYLAEAQELCDEIAFINHGKIIKQDSKDNLLQELDGRYVEVEFAGSVNPDILQALSPDILSSNKLRFNCNSSNYDFNKLFASLHNAGAEIKNVEIQQPDLENVFKKLMRN